MKRITILLFLCLPFIIFSQNKQDTTSISQDTSVFFKKRVLENVEVNLLTSLYTQNGENASITGGVGTEKLNNFAGNIEIEIPLNEDDVLSVDATVSAYSSASSSNLNPFPGDDEDYGGNKIQPFVGSPWVASSGASKSDVWTSGKFGYSHSSDNRNQVYDADINFATEYDYTSFGGGFGITKLFNQKNTSISLGVNVYLDAWDPQYPAEILSFIKGNGNLNSGLFYGVDILDMNGSPINKDGLNTWEPVNTTLVTNKKRNTYTLSISFSQIITKNSQISIFSDITNQSGWLGNPMQRVYFSDKENYYIGNALSIPNYTNSNNKDVFQLADDIERLPLSRYKFPVGIRFNYFINEFLVVRLYYRYYFDNWGINSNTFNIELPVKIGNKFTVYPNYRFYNQTASYYFAPFDQLLSTDEYYTSDYDLSKFKSNQFGLGVSYTDIFTKLHIWKFGLKKLKLEFNHYERNINFKANILSIGSMFVID